MPHSDDISRGLMLGLVILAMAAGVATACEFAYTAMEVSPVLTGRVPEGIRVNGKKVSVSVFFARKDAMWVGPEARGTKLVQRVTTNREGGFELRRLSPGFYNLVLAEGHTEELALYLHVVSGSTGSTNLTEDLARSYNQGEKTKQARIPKRIRDLFGLVVDEQGAVIPDADLILEESPSKTVVARAKSDDSGRFSFEAKAGAYNLRIQKRGFLAAEIPVEIKPDQPLDYEHGIGIQLVVGKCDPQAPTYRLHDLQKDCPARPCPSALTSRRS